MKQTLQLGTLSVANIGMAFLFQWYLFTQLGPGVQTDALFAGMTLPQLILSVISNSLMHVLVPLFAGESEETLRHDAWGYTVLVAAMFSVIAALLYFTAPLWVSIVVPGFSQVALSLTVDLTRIQLIGMVFSAVNGVQWAAYHARGRFIYAEFSPIVANLVALLLVSWVLPRYGIRGAAWISSLRLAIQTILLLPGIGKFVPLNLKRLSIKSAWDRIGPLLLGTTYYKTDPLVDRFLLSASLSGNLSLYYLAQQIYGAINQVLNKAIAAPMVPRLSTLYKACDYAGFRQLYYKRLVQMSAVAVVSFVLIGAFGQFFLGLLIGHGRVSTDNVKDLWWILIWLGGMFIGGATGQITSTTFYACGDTSTPTRMSMLTYTVYTPSKITAFYLWGVCGLAIATSIYLMANLISQLYFLKVKKIV